MNEKTQQAMKCPECGSELVYKEYVEGAFLYPVKDGVIDWRNGELEGECYGHLIQCSNENCEYEMPPGVFQQVLSDSLES